MILDFSGIPMMDGLDDTTNPWRRSPNSAKALFNITHDPCRYFSTIKGRAYNLTGYETTTAGITGLIATNSRSPIASFRPGNNCISFNYDSNNYYGLIPPGDYYSYYDLHQAVVGALTNCYKDADNSPVHIEIGGSFDNTWNSKTFGRSEVNFNNASGYIRWCAGMGSVNHQTTADLSFWYRWAEIHYQGSTSSKVPRYSDPIHDPMVASNLKLWGTHWTSANHDKSIKEIKGRDWETSAESSGSSWTFFDYYGRLYLSDNLHAYIMRDNQHFLKPATADDITPRRAGISAVGAVSVYSHLATPAYYDAITADKFRFPAVPGVSGYPDINLVNLFQIYLKKAAGTATDFWLDVYFEFSDINIEPVKLCSINSGELSDSQGVLVTKYVETAALGIVNNVGISPGWIRIDYRNPEGPKPLEVGWAVSDMVNQYQYLDENGAWKNASANRDVCAFLGQTASLTGSYYWKYSLTNREGVETELSDAAQITGMNGQVVKQIMALDTPLLLDVEYINIYRTIASGSTYYLVGRIPYEYIRYYGHLFNGYVGHLEFSMSEGIPDNELIMHAEADVITARDPLPPGIKYACWSNRGWVLKDNGLLYYSRPYFVDSFDYTYQMMEFNQAGGKALDLIPMIDRLLVLKTNGIGIVYPSGGKFSSYMIDTKGVGVCSSSAAVFVAEAANGVFMQAQDGHFYLFSGNNSLVNISKGKIDSLVNSFNKSALSKTRCVYDSVNKDILWSVCTGDNTTPDKLVFYHLPTRSWHTSDMASEYFLQDHLTSPDQMMIMGCSGGNTFHYYQGNSDLGNNLTAYWEGSDWVFPDDKQRVLRKNYLAVEIYFENSSPLQTATLRWYLDNSASEYSHLSIALDGSTNRTSRGTYRIPLSGTGNSIRFRLEFDDQLGEVKWSFVSLEFEPVLQARL